MALGARCVIVRAGFPPGLGACVLVSCTNPDPAPVTRHNWGAEDMEKEGEKHEPAVWLVVVSPPPGCIELLCCVVSAVTYSPTPWRVQYHQRGQA